MNLSRFCAPLFEFLHRLETVESRIGSLLLFSLVFSTQPSCALPAQNKFSGKSISTAKTQKLFGKVGTAGYPDAPFGELEELNSYSEQFKKRLDLKSSSAKNHWNDVPFRHKLWLYTIDREKFLGNSSVAWLGDDVDTKANPKITPNFSYYLVLMHFNIPAVKATMIPFKYGFARFEAKIACQGTRSISPLHKGLKHLEVTESAEVLSVYPENAVLPINRKDTTTVTLTAQPEWMGASGGKGEYSRAIEDSYAYKLPHVVGVGTRFGDVSWTFYPAKAQPIMLGSQSTFAVVKVPYKTPSLRILANLRYQLQTMKVITFLPFRVCDSCDLDLKEAASFDDMAAIQYFGLPAEAREAMQTAFGKGATERSVRYYANRRTGRDVLVDEKTGETYGIKGPWDQLKQYKIEEE
jgi:hypothetical protein